MTAVDIALRLIGAFYVLGGVILARAILTARVLDAALAALSPEKVNPAAEARALWHLANAVLILAGGVALLLLLDVAVWAFATSLAGQALYFAWLAPRYFDPADPPEAQGRRESVNAFVIYAAATAFLVWGWYQGRLIPWREEPWQLLAAAGAVVAVVAGYVFLIWRAPIPQPGGRSENESAAPPPARNGLADAGRCRRVKVATEHGCYPLWCIDPDNSGNLMPDMLPISADLVGELEDWAADYTHSRDPDDSDARPWKADRYRQHGDAGRRLAVRLATELPHLEVYVPDTYPTESATDLQRVGPAGRGAA
ncbi:MAG: hypothetical protein SFW09_19530 [Hyphomicrobiaceae bacterium]|nr:hypothetical protein [Hyphomicrobiaceae bacterium]